MEAPPTFNDIILPTAPPAAPSSESSSALWFVIAVAALAFLLWRYACRWQRLRGIMRLKRDWHNGFYANRDIVFLLAAEIRRKLKLRQLTVELPPGVAGHLSERWRFFADDLDRIRYQQQGEITPEKLSALLAEARYWIIQAQPPAGIFRRKKC